ncbi:hypothetical protein QYF61_009917 [Mycteria americana]|uniref:[Histone H3]-lysine(4) N-trimethyltransferase n=1 Tax=Mycteria americana TaxID=33587 RepID=A0AAN7RR20_MYCAM|nr:hypothetical protein QYF61_009917 [Mycteria americana]
MGGLSIVSSVPVTAPLVCLLCASKGLHELVLCQVCCQPFHAFCLGAGEGPGPGQAEGWCCRRCKACHACGRRGRAGKPLLECSRCRRCFHPACLGPSAPPRGPRRHGPWLCWGCARCRSCGATPGRGGDPEWVPQDGLCPPCARLGRPAAPRTLRPGCCGGPAGGRPLRLRAGLQRGRGGGAAAGGGRGGPPDDGARELFIQLMVGAFPWFDIRDPKRWRPPGAGAPPQRAAAPRGGEGAEPAVPKAAGGGGADERQCALCLQCGDAPSQEAGRLLYIGQNEWTHVNCALWSAEVFEEGDGTLRNVHAAVARGRQMRCEHCGRPGATVGCCLAACLANYHFMCARRRRAAFQRDKKVFCQRHTRLLDGTELVRDEGFAVLRRVFVDFGGISLKRKFLGGLEPEAVNMMIGSIRIDSLGALTELSECDGRLFPVGYQCWRLYWSTRDARRRCWYRCRILEHHPGPGPEGAPPPRAPRGEPHHRPRPPRQCHPAGPSHPHGGGPRVPPAPAGAEGPVTRRRPPPLSPASPGQPPAPAAAAAVTPEATVTRGTQVGAGVAQRATVNREVIVTQRATVNHEVVVTQRATVNCQVVVTQRATVNREVIVTQRATVNHEVVVTQRATINHEVIVTQRATVNRQVVVTQRATVNRQVVVTQRATINHEVIVTQRATVNRQVVVTQRATVNRQVVVTQRATVNREVIVTQRATVTRGTEATDDPALPPGAVVPLGWPRPGPGRAGRHRAGLGRRAVGCPGATDG